jgi:hypothetical protein
MVRCRLTEKLGGFFVLLCKNGEIKKRRCETSFFIVSRQSPLGLLAPFQGGSIKTKNNRAKITPDG